MQTMTVSTIACSKSLLDWLRGLLAVLGLCLASHGWAAEIEISNPQLLAAEDGYVLSADYTLDFNSRLEEAVGRGVVLYFVVEFEMSRPRWYWFDDKLLTRSQTYRLSYHALTRQYRLSTGALHQSFDSLSDALRILSRLRNWLVIDKAEKADKPLPKAGENYQAALRVRLDVSQLPKPFQIAALGNKDWNLSSDWKVWQLTLPAETK